MRLILIATLLLTVGCFKDPDIDCNIIDCRTGNGSANFRIISAGGGSDLLFGPARAYDPATILFYSVLGNDTTFYPGVKALWGRTTGDSVLSVAFPSEPATALIKLNNFDTDTLQIAYRHFESNKCCAGYTEVGQIIVNGTQVVGAQGLGTHTISK